MKTRSSAKRWPRRLLNLEALECREVLSSGFLHNNAAHSMLHDHGPQQAIIKQMTPPGFEVRAEHSQSAVHSGIDKTPPGFDVRAEHNQSAVNHVVRITSPGFEVRIEHSESAVFQAFQVTEVIITVVIHRNVPSLPATASARAVEVTQRSAPPITVAASETTDGTAAKVPLSEGLTPTNDVPDLNVPIGPVNVSTNTNRDGIDLRQVAAVPASALINAFDRGFVTNRVATDAVGQLATELRDVIPLNPQVVVGPNAVIPQSGRVAAEQRVPEAASQITNVIPRTLATIEHAVRALTADGDEAGPMRWKVGTWLAASTAMVAAFAVYAWNQRAKRKLAAITRQPFRR